MSFDRRLGHRTREVWAVVGIETNVADNSPSLTADFEVYAIAESLQAARDYYHDLGPYANADVTIVETILIES